MSGSAGAPLPEVLERLAAAGYSGIELSGEPARPDRAGLAGELAAADIQATGITATCPAPTDERDLSHADPAARRRAVNYYRGCVDLACEVGAPVVGLIPAPIGRVEGSAVDAWPRAVDAGRAVATYASERGVALGVEAVNRYETFLVNRLEEHNSVAAVSSALPQLRVLHLADSNRLGLGRGQLAIAPLLHAALDGGYCGPFVFEFTAPGPNPFHPDKGAAAMRELDVYVRESVDVVTAAVQR